ncbi:MAG: PstS family phosphate ABC transporter substrate-binding protein [Dehalococcoidia bacterium]|nr:PstS family phosphate ABC transporter substrate-binding protein [Dehalococcoidia bacterium]
MQLKTLWPRWPYLLLAAAASISLVAAACGGDDNDNDGATGSTPPVTSEAGHATDYSSLSGQVRIDGSSTVYPIAQASAEEFRSAAKNVQVNVSFSGTGGGFEKFCRGETQISNASRPIKESEAEACRANGIEPVELQVAVDALTVVVNPANDWAKCMTTEQLALTFKDGGAKKWSDIDSSWPNETIKFYYPGADSGTFDYFVEVLEGVDKANHHRADGTPSEDDNVLAQGVENDKYSIGYFGFAYYVEAGDKLNAVEIDHNGAGCVAPTLENTLEGKYTPLSRPIFMYTSEAFLRDRPEVTGFLRFALENSDQLVQDVGYVPMTTQTLDAQLAKLDEYAN